MSSVVRLVSADDPARTACVQAMSAFWHICRITHLALASSLLTKKMCESLRQNTHLAASRLHLGALVGSISMGYSVSNFHLSEVHLLNTVCFNHSHCICVSMLSRHNISASFACTRGSAAVVSQQDNGLKPSVPVAPIEKRGSPWSGWYQLMPARRVVSGGSFRPAEGAMVRELSEVNLPLPIIVCRQRFALIAFADNGLCTQRTRPWLVRADIVRSCPQTLFVSRQCTVTMEFVEWLDRRDARRRLPLCAGICVAFGTLSVQTAPSCLTAAWTALCQRISKSTFARPGTLTAQDFGSMPNSNWRRRHDATRRVQVTQTRELNWTTH